MAKKTTTTTVEEDITPEAKAVEEHNQGVLDALESQDKPLELEADKLDEEPAKEEPKVEEKVAETAPEPPIDKEAIKAEVKEEVLKEVEALKKDQTPEEKDEYDKFVDDYTAKNGKAPEWKQVAVFLKDQAKTELKAELEAEVEAEKSQELEAQKAQEASQQELNDNLNKDWNEQLDDLVKAGRIPAVVDPNNNEVQEVKDATGKVIEQIPVDPGKRARYDLFKAMYIVSEERINNGAKPLTNLKEIFYEHYGNKQPAGANAPIAGVKKSVSSDSNKAFSYNEVHSKSFEDLLNEAQ